MALEAGCSKQQNNLILNRCNMHLGIEKTEKEISDLSGSQELMQSLETLVSHILFL